MNEPVDAPTLHRNIRDALTTGKVRFTRHALNQMADRGLDERDCTNVLRGGRWDGCGIERGTWRYRWRTPNVVVVVALREDGIVVVTAWGER